MASFTAASLDSTARLVTALLWALAVGLLVGGVIGIQQGAAPAGAILLGAGGSLIALHAWLRRIEPRAYLVEEGP